MVSTYPHMPWEKLRKQFAREWQQGEHVAVIGPTGVGKTTLISQIVPVRKYVVVFVTKVHDSTFQRPFADFERIESWPPKSYQNRVLLWPKAGKEIRETITKQRDTFKKALDRIFLERNWCVVFDEQHYMCRTLGLEPENAMFQHQGRSSGLSIVNGTQRPTWVPLITFSGSTHAFIWKNTFKKDADRLSDIGGIDKRDLEANMNTLDKHDFLYVNSRTGTVARSQVER